MAAATASPSESRPTLAAERAIADGFVLSGISNHPDPATHAYRQDLADAALAGTVIASHYAEPLDRAVVADTDLMAAPDLQAEVVGQIAGGASLRMLDCSRGWAWGYAPDGRVGYVPRAALNL